jgi:hypothetical protein
MTNSIGSLYELGYWHGYQELARGTYGGPEYEMGYKDGVGSRELKDEQANDRWQALKDVWKQHDSNLRDIVFSAEELPDFRFHKS